MRLVMPDGTAIILVGHEDGMIVGTQLSQDAKPSGLVVTGETAEMLAALIETIEEAETESILGS